MNVPVSKQNILNAALKLFSTNGYEATGIEQITNEVGIKKASFYSHFKSKQELLDEIFLTIDQFRNPELASLQNKCKDIEGTY